MWWVGSNLSSHQGLAIKEGGGSSEGAPCSVGQVNSRILRDKSLIYHSDIPSTFFPLHFSLHQSFYMPVTIEATVEIAHLITYGFVDFLYNSISEGVTATSVMQCPRTVSWSYFNQQLYNSVSEVCNGNFCSFLGACPGTFFIISFLYWLLSFTLF